MSDAIVAEGSSPGPEEVTGPAVLLAAAAWRPFLLSRLRSSDAADEAVAELHAQLWAKRELFDRSKGSLQAWAGGFAQRIIASQHREVATDRTVLLEAATSVPSSGLDCADGYEHRLVLRAIAANISAKAYTVWTTRTFDEGSLRDHAKSVGVSVRRFRALVDEGVLVGQTAAAAVAAALDGEVPDGAACARCVTTMHGLREVAQLLEVDDPVAAVIALRQVSKKRAQSLLATARRLVGVAEASFALVERERGNG